MAILIEMNHFQDTNYAIANSPVTNNNSALFEFKQKRTGKTAAGGINDVEIIVPSN